LLIEANASTETGGLNGEIGIHGISDVQEFSPAYWLLS